MRGNEHCGQPLLTHHHRQRNPAYARGATGAGAICFFAPVPVKIRNRHAPAGSQLFRLALRGALAYL